MDRELSNYFFEQAEKAFGFLVREHSFAPPILEIDEPTNFATVTFKGQHLAIECIFDEGEADIDCKVARVLDGRKADDYAVDENRVKVREGLASLVRRQGAREKLFRNVSRLALRERISVTLADFAEMLKTKAKDVLKDSPSALAG